MIKQGIRGLTVFVASSLAPLCWCADWSYIPARDNRGTVLVRAAWVEGSVQGSGTGTGFVVDDKGSIFTVAHQFPLSTTAILLVTGETEGTLQYERQSFTLKIESIDRFADVAVLVPTKPIHLTALPLSWTWTPKETAAVYVRGFPLGGPLAGMPGVVTRTEMTPQVPTTTLLRAGHSGAPVYNDQGIVVGMIRGGELTANLKGDPTVLGLGYFVPLSLLKPKLQADLVARVSNATPSTSTGKPREIRISYPIDATKETLVGCGPTTLFDGPTSEAQPTVGPFQAQPGYRITSAQVTEHSATQVSKKVVSLAPDGSSIKFDFTLTSGPPCDRKRGWLTATLNTVQTLKE